MRWSVHYHPKALAETAEWPADLRAALQRVVDRIVAVGLPQVGGKAIKPIEGKLWELRVSGRDGIGRALYVTRRAQRVVIVLAFPKKTQKTPKRLIEKAL